MSKTELIEKRIKETENQIAAAEEKSAAASPEARVKLENQAAEARAVLDTLRAALEVQKKAENPPEPSPLDGLLKYEKQRDDEIRKAEELEENLRQQAEKAAEALKAAEGSGDVSAIVKAHKAAEDAEKAAGYATEALEAERGKKTFPAGAVLDEWKKICDTRRDEWETAVRDVETMRAGYMQAVRNLETLRDVLTQTREDMGAESVKRDGDPVSFPSILSAPYLAERATSSIEHPWLERLRVTKSEGLEVLRAFEPVKYGVPLI